MYCAGDGKLRKERDDALLQIRDMTNVLRTAEDALGPDRTPQDRHEALMYVGAYLVGMKSRRSEPAEPGLYKDFSPKDDGAAGIRG